MSKFKVGDVLIMTKNASRASNVKQGDVVRVEKEDGSGCPYYVKVIKGYDTGETCWTDDSEVKLSTLKVNTPIMKTLFILKESNDLTAFKTKPELMDYIDGDDCDGYEVFEVQVTKSFKIDDTPRLIKVKQAKKAVKKVAKKAVKKTAKRA